MIKNKNLVYILLPLVGFIWYKVFVRIASNLEEVQVPKNSQTTDLSQVHMVRDTFHLQANYRDPFGPASLAVNPSQPPSSETEPIRETQSYKARSEKQAWYPIKYYGLIRKVGSNTPLAVINIDREQFFLRKGEEAFDGYKVLVVTRDSVQVQYQHEKKYFRKSK